MGIDDYTADYKSKSAYDFSAPLGGPSNDGLPGYSRIDPTAGLKPDALRKLQGYDTIFILDDSTSMSWSIDQLIADAQYAQLKKRQHYLGPVGVTRWQVAAESVALLVGDAGRYDKDGIDVHFLNDLSMGRGLMNVLDAQAVIQRVLPNGGTPIGAKLNQILFAYLRELERTKDFRMDHPERPKPLNILVITDGAATDRDVLRSTIVETTKVLDRLHCPFEQVGIQFVQIGRDKEAEKFLKDLDDNLTKSWSSSKRATRDIVDTIVCKGKTDFSAALLAKILTGGIDRRLDSQSRKQVQKGQLCY